jgi:hypothetical protein
MLFSMTKADIFSSVVPDLFEENKITDALIRKFGSVAFE